MALAPPEGDGDGIEFVNSGLLTDVLKLGCLVATCNGVGAPATVSDVGSANNANSVCVQNSLTCATVTRKRKTGETTTACSTATPYCSRTV